MTAFVDVRNLTIATEPAAGGRAEAQMSGAAVIVDRVSFQIPRDRR